MALNSIYCQYIDMINQQEITQEWLERVSRANQKADKILIEKVIRALLLLEGLVKQKLPFVFKGGTALMLHFDSTKRLSIDIDIILLQTIDHLDEILTEVVKEQNFLRVELQHRYTDAKIQKAHYKFFYTPLHRTRGTEEYVLLDILFEQVHYAKILSLPIRSAFIPNIDKPLTVPVPSLEDLLGDKLTAFAPNTTGIPYFKNEVSMSMEIIKQLYDIGNLFDRVSDIEIVKTTFYHFAKTELLYRNLPKATELAVLNDIYQTALCIVSRGKDGVGNFEELQKGIQRIAGFIFSEKYHIEKVILHASKAAYLAILIKDEAQSIEKFTHSINMNHWNIDNSPLNKLKKSNQEAFFYWHKIHELSKI